MGLNQISGPKLASESCEATGSRSREFSEQ